VDVSLTLRVLPRKPVSPICDCYSVFDSVFELMFSLYVFMLPLHNICDLASRGSIYSTKRYIRGGAGL
jgi:hypothetical protein